jgi:hypothetical protein
LRVWREHGYSFRWDHAHSGGPDGYSHAQSGSGFGDGSPIRWSCAAV